MSPESAQVVVPQSSIFSAGSCDPSDRNDTKCFVVTYEVCLLAAPCNTFTHGFAQVSTQAITDDIQGAEKNISNINPVSGRAETVMNAIGTANTAIVHLDTISSTHLQPLHTFNAIVTGIANVHVQITIIYFDRRSCIDTLICPNGAGCIDYDVPGIYRLSTILDTIN